MLVRSTVDGPGKELDKIASAFFNSARAQFSDLDFFAVPFGVAFLLLFEILPVFSVVLV
jgi:hypothetical protein